MLHHTGFLVAGRPSSRRKQYRDHGEAFLRAAGPGVLIVGVGAATVSAAAGSTVFISAGVAGAAVATVVVLPVYYLSVLGINHHNKKAVMTEFKRRRLPLPLMLACYRTLADSGALIIWGSLQGRELTPGCWPGLAVPLTRQLHRKQAVVFFFNHAITLATALF